MAVQEVHVVEVREMLRLWVRGHAYKSIARLTQIDRKTVRRDFRRGGTGRPGP